MAANDNALLPGTHLVLQPPRPFPATCRNPTFSGLPVEILWDIVERLVFTDTCAFLLLRSVCRATRTITDHIRMRQLLYQPEPGKCRRPHYHAPSFNTEDCRGDCRGLTQLPLSANWAAYYTRRVMRTEKRKAMRELLRRDTLCRPCRDLYAAQAALPQQPFNRDAVHHCVFTSWPARLLYCYNCASSHPARAFSPIQQTRPPLERVCIGRQGRVRLCEHVSINWKEIELHIMSGAAWKFKTDRLVDNWVRAFSRVCKHPSHASPVRGPSTFLPADGGCPGAWGASAWPRASLRYETRAGFKGGQLFLELSWRPHSGGFHPVNGADGLRDLFREYRRTAAPFLVPGSTADPNTESLPEMLALDPLLCSCKRDQIPSTTKRHPPAPHGGLSDWPEGTANVPPNKYVMWLDMADKLWKHRAARKRLHHVRFNDASGTSTIHVMKCAYNTEAATVTAKDDDTAPPSCLLTWYRREIALGTWDETNGRLEPSHGWLHAMDPDTYDWTAADGAAWVKRPMPVHVRPRCRDPRCARNARLQARRHRCLVDGRLRGFHPLQGSGGALEGIISGRRNEVQQRVSCNQNLQRIPGSVLGRLSELVAVKMNNAWQWVLSLVIDYPGGDYRKSPR